MVLSVQNIIDYLEEYGYTVHHSISTLKANLTGCRWLYSDNFTHGILYIEPYTAPQLNRISLVTMVTYGNDILRVESSEPELLFNLVNETFQFYANWERRLLECILYQKPLNDLLTIAEEVFRAPMIIDGIEGQCYAITRNYPADIHPLWRNRLENDAESYRFIRQTAQIPRYIRLQQSTSPMFNPSIEWPWNTMYSNLFYKGHRAGFIVAYEYQHKMRPGDLHLMYVFSRIVEQHIAQYPEKYCYTMYIEYFLYSVLFRDLDNWVKLQTILNYRKWTFEDPYCVYCILAETSESEDSENEQITRLATLLRVLLSDIVCITHKNTLIILINQTISGAEQVLLEHIPQNMYCGRSMDFHNLREIRNYYQQAAAVADMSIGKHCHMLRAEDCIASQITKLLISNPYTLTLLPDELKNLAKYDKAHKAELLQTLRALVICNMNSTDTAQFLNIHRNTLLQRIHRIEKIINMSLDSFINQQGYCGLLLECNILMS